MYERLSNLGAPEEKFANEYDHTNLITISATQIDRILIREFIRNEQALLYHENKPADQYPGALLKRIHNTKHCKTSIDKITNKWESRFTDINTLETIKMTRPQLDLTSKLDSTHYKEHKFRISIVNKLIPTAQRLKMFNAKTDPDRSATCIRCKLVIENQNHIFSCIKTKNKMSSLIQQTKELILKISENNPKRKDILSLFTPENMHLMLGRLGLTNSGFLRKPEARGIITESTLISLEKEFPHKSKHIVTTIIDCWLHAFYQTVWIPRLKLMQENTNSNIEDNEELHNTTDTGKKNAGKEEEQSDINGKIAGKRKSNTEESIKRKIPKQIRNNSSQEKTNEQDHF
jgi:hypothetical protein